jgi:membrane protein
MSLGQIKRAVVRTVDDVAKNHTMTMAAGLSYNFVLSLFPLLIMAAALVGYLPIPNLFDQILGSMARVIPADSMGLVRQVLRDVISPNKGKLLSVGLLGTLWTASSGFSTMIEALDVAYDIPETRPFWRTRALAIALTFEVGILFVLALAVMVVGPEFGGWLAGKVDLGPLFTAAWPYLRWMVAIAFTVLGVEVLYFVAPNIRQRFLASLPGACLAVGSWIGLSYLLGLYFQKFANFNKTYGTLGAAIALMVWLYWSSFAILLGAELNSELMQVSGNGKLPLKQPPPAEVTPRPASESELAA